MVKPIRLISFRKNVSDCNWNAHCDRFSRRRLPTPTSTLRRTSRARPSCAFSSYLFAYWTHNSVVLRRAPIKIPIIKNYPRENIYDALGVLELWKRTASALSWLLKIINGLNEIISYQIVNYSHACKREASNRLLIARRKLLFQWQMAQVGGKTVDESSTGRLLTQPLLKHTKKLSRNQYLKY